MEYSEELLELFALRARKYCGSDSSSLPYDKAQMIMEGILYCIHEYENSNTAQVTNGHVPLKELYDAGAALVMEKVQKTRELYNRIIVDFDDYQVTCLRDTVKKGIPEFLKWYDFRFFPQETILTLDYPVFLDVRSCSGVDAVYRFVKAIELEMTFLKGFERTEIILALQQAVPAYRSMIENVCEIFLQKVIGDAIKKERKACQSEEDIRHMLHFMVEREYNGDKELEDYLFRIEGEIWSRLQ